MEQLESQVISQAQTDYQPNVPVVPSKEPSQHLFKRLFRSMKKNIIYVIGLVIVAAIILTWQMVRMGQEATWSRATDYFARAEYEKAAKELNGVGVPSSSERLRVYGQTMLATRQLDKSLEAYTKLYYLNKDPSVKIIIGNIYNEQKKYDESIKIYREVISANPNNVQAFVNMATVYKLQNNEKEAAKIAKEGVEKNPNSVVLLELRVSMLMSDKSSPEYKEAVEALKQVNPQDQLLQALNEV